MIFLEYYFTSHLIGQLFYSTYEYVLCSLLVVEDAIYILYTFNTLCGQYML